MTDAYIEGFCKTAEEHGVEPHALMKIATRYGFASKAVAEVARRLARVRGYTGTLNAGVPSWGGFERLSYREALGGIDDAERSLREAVKRLSPRDVQWAAAKLPVTSQLYNAARASATPLRAELRELLRARKLVPGKVVPQATPGAKARIDTLVRTLDRANDTELRLGDLRGLLETISRRAPVELPK